MNDNTSSTLSSCDKSSTSCCAFKKYLPIIMWLIVAIFYFYENILQVSPGVMVPELMRELHVNAEALGNLSAFYFYAYASMQIPVGLLLDRFGPRRLVTMALISCVLGTFLFGNAHAVWQAELGRFFIGFGSAFAAVSCLAIAANWFSYKHFALLTGMMITIGFAGGVAGETPLAAMVMHWGWRHSMFSFSVIGLVLACLAWLIINDKPDTERAKAHHEHTHGETGLSIKNILRGLAFIIASKECWLVVIYGGLMFAPTSIFGALWGVPFLMQAYHLPRDIAAGIISMLYIGWMIGAPLGGFISDKIGKRKTLMRWASVGAFASMMFIIYVPNLSNWILSALVLFFGFSSAGFLLSFSVIKEINSPKNSGTALGYMNMFNMIGGAVGQPLVGMILDHFWSGQMQNGIRVYSVSNFHYALAALPIMLGISFFIVPFIKETYCRPCHDEAITV